MNDPSGVVSSVLRQTGEGLVAMTGWIGTHPGDGTDVAHLLLHPIGHGVANKMRLLGDVAQLGRGDDVATLVDADPASAAVAISRERGDIWAQLILGGTLVAERPITEEIAAPAQAHGCVILTIGQDPWDGRAQTHDRYLARGHRLRVGRVQLVDPMHSGGGV